MKKLLSFGIAIAAIGVAPAFANVDPKIAEFCLKAQDFQGCVDSLSGKKPEATTTTIRQVQQQGANLTEGNSCPAQHAYSGGGYCQRVICVKRGLFGKGHSQYLGDRGMKCDGGSELTWDNTYQPIRASVTSNCPLYEPEIGFQSTCVEANHKGYVKAIAIGYQVNKDKIVINIVEDSPASRAGLKIGDRIDVDVKERKIGEPKPKGWELGRIYEIKVQRGGQSFTLDAKADWINIPMSYYSQGQD